MKFNSLKEYELALMEIQDNLSMGKIDEDTADSLYAQLSEDRVIIEFDTPDDYESVMMDIGSRHEIGKLSEQVFRLMCKALASFSVIRSLKLVLESEELIRRAELKKDFDKLGTVWYNKEKNMYGIIVLLDIKHIMDSYDIYV